MLGAVVYGQKHFQPVLDAIVKLAERAAKEPWELKPKDDGKIASRACVGVAEAELARCLWIAAKHERRDRVAAIKEKVIAALVPADDDGNAGAQSRHRLQRSGEGRCPLEHPRHREAHRWARPEHRQADRLRGRHPAAHPWQRAVHPRRDPGARRRHARHRRGRAICRRPPGHLQRDLPAALQLPALFGRRGWPHVVSPGRREIGHGKLAWRAIHPVLPEREQLPLHHPHRVGDHRVERLLVDGDGVRLIAGHDGRGHSAQALGSRHRHGPDQGRR